MLIDRSTDNNRQTKPITLHLAHAHEVKISMMKFLPTRAGTCVLHVRGKIVKLYSTINTTNGNGEL